MDFSERAGWLILGALIGFVLGYIVRSLREIKEELDEVDDILREDHNKGKRDQRGAAELPPAVLNSALLVVVVVTVWAAIASQLVSNNVEKNQDRIERVTACNQQYLNQTIIALNQRTSFTQAQAQANLDLQKDQFEFFNIILENPSNDKIELAAFKDYIASLKNFFKVNNQALKKVQFNPYPTSGELATCLDRAEQ